MPIAKVAATPAPLPMPMLAATPKTSAAPTPMPTNASASLPVSRAAKVSKMMKGLVPVTDLAAAIDQLTVEDLRSNAGLASELIAIGGQSSSVPVRLATVQALVRCRIATPEAMTVLQTAAQSDPESSIRTVATAGLGGVQR